MAARPGTTCCSASEKCKTPARPRRSFGGRAGVFGGVTGRAGGGPAGAGAGDRRGRRTTGKNRRPRCARRPLYRQRIAKPARAMPAMQPSEASRLRPGEKRPTPPAKLVRPNRSIAARKAVRTRGRDVPAQAKRSVKIGASSAQSLPNDKRTRASSRRMRSGRCATFSRTTSRRKQSSSVNSMFIPQNVRSVPWEKARQNGNSDRSAKRASRSPYRSLERVQR